MDIVRKAQTQMKSEGHRYSKTREAILNLLGSHIMPLSVPEILEQLQINNVTVNKSTVYREIEKLLHHQLLDSVYLDDEVVRYELSSVRHHHHVICTRCRKIEDVIISQDLSTEEINIAVQKKFKILKHSLEFYGICQKCQN